MDIKIYEKANHSLKDALKMRGDNISLYALRRIEELEQLALCNVSNRRELLIDFLTSLEKGGGNRFVSKEWIADNYLQGN